MQIIHFILDKILKLLTYYRPFYHQSLQSDVISKKVRFSWPTLYCSTVMLIFPFLQTNMTSQMWPSGDKGQGVL